MPGVGTSSADVPVPTPADNVTATATIAAKREGSAGSGGVKRSSGPSLVEPAGTGGDNETITGRR